MTLRRLSGLLLLVAALATSAVAQQPKQQKKLQKKQEQQQLKHMTWKVDGLQREGLVYVPTRHEANGKSPVILVFHGHGGGMNGFAKATHFQTAWPEAIVVYLEGLPIETGGDRAGKEPGWDSGPDAVTEKSNRDVDLVDAVLATMRHDFPVDANRIYATGFSNGAFFSMVLWVTRGSTFAAIAPVAGIIRDWKPTIPRPVIYIGGMKDSTVKPEVQKQTVAAIRTFDSANAAGSPCGPGCTLYPSTTGTPVRVLTHPGGHEFPPIATGAIVAFFKNHQLKT